MSDRLAIAAVVVAGLVLVFWTRRLATISRPSRKALVGYSMKAFEHVACGRLNAAEAGVAMLGADKGCEACAVLLKAARRLPAELHEHGKRGVR
ncbi:MAG: hypothetical protein HOW73_47795 [Polyangiaceae bacterium]|nr:hypothetical protein [Polyangiaceae bacterium]